MTDVPNTFLTVSGLLTGIVDALDTGIVLLDDRHRIRVWNTWMEWASGRQSAELSGKSLWDAFPGLRNTHLASAVEDALDNGASSVLSHTLHAQILPLRLRDGQPVTHSAIVRPFVAGAERYCLIQITDQTASANRERVLRERRDERYRAVVGAAQEAIVTTDIAGTIQWMNGAAERHFGIAQTEVVGNDIGTLLARGDAGRWPRGGTALAWSTQAAPIEIRGRRHDGTLFDAELSIGRWTSDGRTFLTGILRDVTERLRALDALQSALADKTILLREINHRVKNSLQLVSGLLNLQVATVDSDVARAHLRDAAHRIGAVARVHHRLYQTDRFHTIDFAVFLRELCADLAKATGGAIAEMRVDTDAIEIPNDQATPLGLVANELITNAIKHSGTARPRVHVELGRDVDHFTLTVSDEGPGLPEGFDPRKSRSLGMRIVTALVPQVSGTLEILPTGCGAVFRVRVPLPDPVPADAGPTRIPEQGHVP